MHYDADYIRALKPACRRPAGWAGHRPPGDAADRFVLDPRRAAVPVHAAENATDHIGTFPTGSGRRSGVRPRVARLCMEPLVTGGNCADDAWVEESRVDPDRGAAPWTSSSSMISPPRAPCSGTSCGTSGRSSTSTISANPTPRSRGATRTGRTCCCWTACPAWTGWSWPRPSGSRCATATCRSCW